MAKFEYNWCSESGNIDLQVLQVAVVGGEIHAFKTSE